MPPPFVVSEFDNSLVDRTGTLPDWAAAFVERHGLGAEEHEYILGMVSWRAYPSTFDVIRIRDRLFASAARLRDAYCCDIAGIAIASCPVDSMTELPLSLQLVQSGPVLWQTRRSVRLLPAPAGMDPRRRRWRPGRPAAPRTRGDGPKTWSVGYTGWRNGTPAKLIKIAEALNCPIVVLERKRGFNAADVRG